MDVYTIESSSPINKLATTLIKWKSEMKRVDESNSLSSKVLEDLPWTKPRNRYMKLFFSSIHQL